MSRKFDISIVAYKKLFSVFVSVVIFINVFSFVSKQNTDLFVADNVHVASSISKHYNLLVSVPVKIVGECFNADLAGLNGIGTEQTSKSKDKNNDENETISTMDFAFSISGTTDFVCSYSKFVRYDLFVSANKPDFNKIRHKLYVSFIVVFIFVLGCCTMLARGDTEDSIINKKGNKVIRLV